MLKRFYCTLSLSLCLIIIKTGIAWLIFSTVNWTCLLMFDRQTRHTTQWFVLSFYSLAEQSTDVSCSVFEDFDISLTCSGRSVPVLSVPVIGIHTATVAFCDDEPIGIVLRVNAEKENISSTIMLSLRSICAMEIFESAIVDNWRIVMREGMTFHSVNADITCFPVGVFDIIYLPLRVWNVSVKTFHVAIWKRMQGNRLPCLFQIEQMWVCMHTLLLTLLQKGLGNQSGNWLEEIPLWQDINACFYVATG